MRIYDKSVSFVRPNPKVSLCVLVPILSGLSGFGLLKASDSGNIYLYTATFEPLNPER
jgi:hypothetical protein